MSTCNDGLPEYGFVRTETVRRMLGISKTTLYREISFGNIPAPIHITKKCLGWPVEVIRDFFDGKRREQKEQDELFQVAR